jgi:hypothetical protein
MVSVVSIHGQLASLLLGLWQDRIPWQGACDGGELLASLGPGSRERERARAREREKDEGPSTPSKDMPQ